MAHPMQPDRDAEAAGSASDAIFYPGTSVFSGGPFDVLSNPLRAASYSISTAAAHTSPDEQPADAESTATTAVTDTAIPRAVVEQTISAADVTTLIGIFENIELTDECPHSRIEQLPKGYAMQSEFNGHVELLKARARRKLEAGHLPSRYKSRASKYGFDPVEVMNSNALNPSQGCPYLSSTLNVPIHPLLALDRFLDYPEELYNILKPALRLASLFLTHRVTSSFWHTLMFGKRELCPDASRAAGCDIYRIRYGTHWNAQNAAAFAELLMMISNKISIQFENIDPRSQTFGTCWIPGEARRILPLDVHRWRRALIDMHLDIHSAAKQLSLLKGNADPAMVLRFHFFVAVNLTHELAHFLETAQESPSPDFRIIEPFIGNQEFNELGAACETILFGGRVHPVNWRLDCAHGLATYDWPQTDGTEYRTISMDYIAKVQQQATWDGELRDADATALHISRNGARSVGVMVFSTMIWEDGDKDNIADEDDHKDEPLRRVWSGRIVKTGRRKGSRSEPGKKNGKRTKKVVREHAHDVLQMAKAEGTDGMGEVVMKR
ncbi:hypothetical protein H2203_002834 [Taxawa tesnikishii (nom. ined.)]|nr:hypothetical protein H2203_002834 [Dothideales sp. JES 119]